MENYALFELELCKVHNQLKALEGNEYSNKYLDSYQQNIFKLFQKISTPFDVTDLSELTFRGDCLSIISQSFQFLEDSVLNVIPYETVFCLDKILKEWEVDDYILVTSFKRNKYSFDPSLSLDTSTTFTGIKYTFTDIKFQRKLIQISIPKHDVNDYFFSIVLYHELAHYIDLKFKITESLMNEEYSDLEGIEKEKQENHLREHFADIFASQYIGDAFPNYLESKALEDGESLTHPSTSRRIELIHNFIDEEKSDLFDSLNKATKLTTGKELKIRYEPISKIEDFYNFIPPVIENDKQLHGLFVAGWEIWMGEDDNDKKVKFNEENSNKIYKYINNLIEKAISNYMVKSIWDKAKNK